MHDIAQSIQIYTIRMCQNQFCIIITNGNTLRSKVINNVHATAARKNKSNALIWIHTMILCVRGAFIFIPVLYRRAGVCGCNGVAVRGRILERYQRLRASRYATRGRRPCARAGAGAAGRRPQGGTDPRRSVTTPLFIATQPNPAEPVPRVVCTDKVGVSTPLNC